MTETKKEREERLEEAREERKEEAKEEKKELEAAIAAAEKKEETRAVVAKSAVSPEVPKPEKVVSSNEKRKAKILEELEKCLTEYGGETNVPYTHQYWTLLKEFRSL